jgi:hypothetical protein
MYSRHVRCRDFVKDPLHKVEERILDLGNGGSSRVDSIAEDLLAPRLHLKHAFE